MSTATRYILISTYETALQAARTLSQHTTLILDCEGCELGMPAGTLSIIAIGDASASTIFLFDVLALSEKQHPFLAPLISLLRNADITKLVWDGRSDFYEIADTYGVLMEGILDLQLVEIAHRRTVQPKKNSMRAQHTAKFFKTIQKELDGDPSALDGIYRLFGLAHCANLFYVDPGASGKDPAVVALHNQNGSSIWLQRPLAHSLLAYSAHDIELIAQLYARFLQKRKYLKDYVELKAMSARYMRVIGSREMRALYVPLDLSRFLPMDVLTAPPEGERYRCERCERMLSLSCFGTRHAPKPTGVTGDTLAITSRLRYMQRLSFCRLCSLLARKRAEPSFGYWVAIVG